VKSETESEPLGSGVFVSGYW